MNDEGVCRAAPATPGLLNMPTVNSEASSFYLLLLPVALENDCVPPDVEVAEVLGREGQK